MSLMNKSLVTVNSKGKTFDFVLRAILIGNSGVGKSCILKRFGGDEFYESFMPTIGIDFESKIIEVENKKVKLQTWDSAGQERFRTITKAYLRGANIVMYVIDVTDMDSFNGIQNWMKEVENSGNDQNVAVIVANKCDLDQRRVVSLAMIEELANRTGAPFVEVSARSGCNVDLAFEMGAKLFMDKKGKQLQQAPPSLPRPRKIEKKRDCCSIM